MARVKFLASKILESKILLENRKKVRVRKVRVQLEGSQYLHMSEVQVFDQNGVNVALNKPARQSSTYSSSSAWSASNTASNAVNGIFTDFSCTGLDQGKYTHSQL